MHLAPRDVDKVLLHQVGTLAQKRLARGLRLNYPEAVALLSTVLLERIRDGVSVAHLMAEGKTILGRNQVMDGIADLVHEVQVEGTFPDGTKLVTVHEPIVADDGNLELALYGSFLPVPKAPLSLANISPEAETPGGTFLQDAPIVLNEDRDVLELTVTSVGDRPIQVGSHFPFEETNRALHFDREKAAGMRLCIPAGTAVRFEPGETKTVRLIACIATEAFSDPSSRRAETNASVREAGDGADISRNAFSGPASRRAETNAS